MNQNNRKRVRALKATVADLDKRILELDRWFLSNMQSPEWNSKINTYWILTDRRNETHAKMRRIEYGQTELIYQPTIYIPQ